MTLPLDDQSSNNSHKAEPEDLASDTSTKGSRKARAKQVAAAPTALDDNASDMTEAQKALEVATLTASSENDANARCGYGNGATLPLVPPEGIALIAPANGGQAATPDSVQLEGAPLDDWARAHPLPLAGAPLRDWARALRRAGLYPVRGHGVVTPATPCECADKKTCEHRARCTCGKATCTSPGKHPNAGMGWQDKGRSFDPDAFVEGDNIGLLMGQQRGGEYLIALDVDDLERMTTLVGALGDPGPTMVGRSGRGERRIYRLGDDVPRGKDRLKNITGLVLEVERQHPPAGVRPEDVRVAGVDCKVDGGYLVVGPSLHPTGVRYVWSAWREPAVLPALWTDALLAPEQLPKSLEKYGPAEYAHNKSAQRTHYNWVQKTAVEKCRLIAAAAPGTAHDLLVRTVTALYQKTRGVGGTEAERLMVEVEVRKAASCRRIPAKEVEDVLRDQWHYVQGTTPHEKPPLRPRPGQFVERFPGDRPALVRHAPAGEGDEADREAIEREEQQLEDWDGHSPLTLEGEAGARVRVAGITIDAKGYPTKTAGNVAIMLAGYPGGPPRYNEFHDVVTWPDGRTYDENSDLVDVENWLLAHPETCVRAKPEAIDKGIAYAARKRSFHPVRDYLRVVEWDKTPRVERLFSSYFGAMHSAYVEAVSRCFMVGAVARILRPGCKLDTMPVLEGAQGIGKSRALRILAGEWFSDSTITDKSPDCFQALRGVWIYELAELASVRGRESERIKAYVSSAVDRYRTSYARRVADVPRQVAFAGTTNASTYLSDDTGNRRYHPIACGLIDLEALRRDRDQLWAEAVVMLERGEDWHLSPELEVQQRGIAVAREHEDSWAEAVAGWRVTGATVTIQRGLSLLLIDVGKQTKADAMRLALLLTKQGWSKGRQTLNGQRIVLWTPPLTA